ncbi:hypothetical protein CALCODRAFT_518847 [Calocera cornea HHB12733]|uniref:Secreted protein n=1 Tax=Calocera cornea HHB12733 TaxID=1353952 RepID=A0A165ENR0_9BASI|nr:hypothetical protein CALCODRAFT_518847 [Calocera cornea HHB12733]
MKLSALLAVTALCGLSLAQSSLLVLTPAAVVTCQDTLLAWGGGQAPFYVSIIPGGQVSAQPIESFPATSASNIDWLVNLAAGTSISIQVTDAAGWIAYSSPVTVQAGTSTSCL